MCIAIYSPKGNNVPSFEYLHNCFDNNSDGAGFAFNHNGHVDIVKGLMTWEEFYSAFNAYNEKYDLKKCGLLIHFRISTHGKIDKANCHPFPVSNSNRQLSKTKTSVPYACVHNGIISLTSADAKIEKTHSDTFIFVRDYLSKIASNKGWFQNRNNIQLIESLISSKMAILDGKGNIISTTGFTKDDDGNYYSNDSYRYSFRYDYFSFDYDEPLMQLRLNEAVIFSDGDCQDYSDDDCTVLLNENGDVFFCENNTDRISSYDLVYVGEGVFVDSNNPFDEKGELKVLPFRDDIKCSGGTSFGYYL